MKVTCIEDHCTYADPFARKLPSAHAHRVMLVTRLRSGTRLQRLGVRW